MDKSKSANQPFENYALSRSEYISAMVHFYRGELTRANTWRIRLDTTTNWAIIASMGFLSYAFGVKEHSHASIVLGMLMIAHFLALEARRFRFFDVWRNRLRMIEENFYGPILTRDLHSPARHWGKLVAGDLLHPRFKISYWQACRSRLIKNYLTIYIILLGSWFLKLAWQPHMETDVWHHRMGFGPVPWYCVLAVVAILYSFLIGLIWLVEPVASAEREQWGAENHLGHIPDF